MMLRKIFPGWLRRDSLLSADQNAERGKMVPILVSSCLPSEMRTLKEVLDALTPQNPHTCRTRGANEGRMYGVGG